MAAVRLPLQRTWQVIASDICRIPSSAPSSTISTSATCMEQPRPAGRAAGRAAGAQGCRRGLGCPWLDAGAGAWAALRDLCVTRYARDIVGGIAHGDPRSARGKRRQRALQAPTVTWNSIRDFRFAFSLRAGRRHSRARHGRQQRGHRLDRRCRFPVQPRRHGGAWRPRRARYRRGLDRRGFVVTPVHKALSQILGRAVLFRHRDADLRLARKRPRPRSRGRHQAPRILDDFSMQPTFLRQTGALLAFAMASTADVLSCHPSRPS